MARALVAAIVFFVSMLASEAALKFAATVDSAAEETDQNKPFVLPVEPGSEKKAKSHAAKRHHRATPAPVEDTVQEGQRPHEFNNAGSFFKTLAAGYKKKVLDPSVEQLVSFAEGIPTAAKKARNIANIIVREFKRED
mmetsp:Transcript_62807/g.187272  ORF Transcript_62807/g.187272 Transcript_62807/m.187272 type:complete len:138 (-) Transcript_62807:75-488(-)